MRWYADARSAGQPMTLRTITPQAEFAGRHADYKRHREREARGDNFTMVENANHFMNRQRLNDLARELEAARPSAPAAPPAATTRTPYRVLDGTLTLPPR